MNIYGQGAIAIVAVILFVSLIAVIGSYVKSPFEFPYKRIEFDVTSKKQPDINDYIDNYLINNGMNGIMQAREKLSEWNKYCEYVIQKSAFKRRREKQYLECYDEKHLYIFALYRMQTRYRQSNYVKTPYRVKVCDVEYGVNYDFVASRYEKLKEIDFECTFNEYHSKNQRRLMTKELREMVAKRDNYTCRICGKYMPDGVGLHIDHIIPVSKGGKSVASNLQVLCSKCNGTKSNK